MNLLCFILGLMIGAIIDLSLKLNRKYKDADKRPRKMNKEFKLSMKEIDRESKKTKKKIAKAFSDYKRLKPERLESFPVFFLDYGYGVSASMPDEKGECQLYVDEFRNHQFCTATFELPGVKLKSAYGYTDQEIEELKVMFTYFQDGIIDYIKKYHLKCIGSTETQLMEQKYVRLLLAFDSHNHECFTVEIDDIKALYDLVSYLKDRAFGKGIKIMRASNLIAYGIPYTALSSEKEFISRVLSLCEAEGSNVA